MSFKKFAVAAFLLIASTSAFAQGTQFPTGTIWGNDTASQRPGKVSTLTSIFDRVFGSTRGTLLSRGASGWATVGPGATARVPWLSGGTGADPVLGPFSIPSSVTSGGVLCFTSTTVSTSSAALTANALTLGGGAGACPSSIGSLGTTTTLLHGNAGGAPTFGQVVYADIASAALATAANYFAGASSVIVPADQIYQGEVTITYGTTTTIDFNTLINGVVTLSGGNITTLTLTNVKAGKAGQIRFIQDATGSRTWPAGGNTIFKYTIGALPALSTAANAVDVLVYSCSTATFCLASLVKDARNP